MKNKKCLENSPQLELLKIRHFNLKDNRKSAKSKRKYLRKRL